MRFFWILLIMFPLNVFGQALLKGKVMDENNKPVAGASIFLNTTSIGTTAGSDGSFELNLPPGKNDLIVSSVGYNTFSKTINSSEPLDFLTVRLTIKASELEAVIIEPFEQDGWQKWGRFFLENFIGTSEQAALCEIKNYKIIRFRHSRSNGQLTAHAFEPLIIENKALGYRIRYQLESFEYNFKTGYLIFTGYPFFEEMSGTAGKKKKWAEARAQAYEGSMMHFMRAVYRNLIVQEGFEVRHLQKFENTEKKRIKELYKENTRRTPGGTIVAASFDADSTAYYEKILRQKDYHEIIGKDILVGDSIAYAADSTTAGLAFNDYLLVIYKHKLAQPAYIRRFPESSTAIMSQLLLVNSKPVEIESNGSYFAPEDLLSLGYWAWSEKIALMLPFDYKK